MNFELAICGLSHVRLAFHDIWPSLPTDDFVAYVLHKVKSSLPRGSLDLKAFEGLTSRTCLLFSDDGTLRRLLCGPPPGSKGAAPDAEPAARCFATCGEAFGFLDDGTREGMTGWLYFAYQRQVIECHCVDRDDIGGFKRFTNTQEKHRHADVCGVDLTFGDVVDVKRAVVARGMFRAVEDVALLVDRTAVAPHVAASAQGDSVELPDDELLFPLLRDSGRCAVLLVQRSGITVTVMVGAKRLLLPRMGHNVGTVQDVMKRLRQSFHVTSDLLFLEGREEEGALQPAELLCNLLSADGEAHLSTTLPTPPPAPFVNEGGTTVRIAAKSANSPRRFPVSMGGAPHLTHAVAQPSQVSVVPSGYHPPSGAEARRSFSSPRRDAQGIADEVHALTATYASHNGEVLVESLMAPRVTCRVDVSDCTRSTAAASGGGGVVDVVLPDDGLPFTGRDMKQFLVANHVLSSSYAASTDLKLLHGHREVADYEDLHDFVVTPHGNGQTLQTATVLLRCARNR